MLGGPEVVRVVLNSSSSTHETNTPDPRTMRTRTNIKNRNAATGTGTVLRFVCITSVRSAPTVGIHTADRHYGKYRYRYRYRGYMRRRFAIFLAHTAVSIAISTGGGLFPLQPSNPSLWTARISQSGRGVGLRGFPVADGEQCGGSWANRINSALELAPMATVVAFIMIDIGSAAILFSILMALNIRVPSDFALAYTVCKGALRVPRLALDASGAALLARLWPSLASIRVSLMIDAATRGGTSLRQRLFPASAAQASETRSKAMDTVRQLTDRYGLAYMAAKNVIGPVSILLLYVALRTTGGAEGLMGRFGSSANGVGLLASRLALASTASTLLFPGVVMGAAVLGPTLDQARKNAVSLLYSGKTRSEQ